MRNWKILSLLGTFVMLSNIWWMTLTIIDMLLKHPTPEWGFAFWSWSKVNYSKVNFFFDNEVDEEQFFKHLEFGHEDHEDENCSISSTPWKTTVLTLLVNIIELDNNITVVQVSDSDQEPTRHGNPSTVVLAIQGDLTPEAALRKFFLTRVENHRTRVLVEKISYSVVQVT